MGIHRKSRVLLFELKHMEPQDGVFVVHTVVLDGTLVIKYNVVLLVAVRYFIVVVIAVIISIAVLSVPITVSVHHDVVIKQLYYLLTVLTR